MRPYIMRNQSNNNKGPFEPSNNNKAPVRVSATHLDSKDAPQLKKKPRAEDEEKPTPIVKPEKAEHTGPNSRGPIHA